MEAEELEIARLLLDAGYQLNDVPRRTTWYKFGGTAIIMAAENGYSDMVQLFLDRGADPDIPGTVAPLLALVYAPQEAVNPFIALHFAILV